MIKVYDSNSQQYTTIASNRGDKLYTKNINFSAPELPNYDDDESIREYVNVTYSFIYNQLDEESVFEFLDITEEDLELRPC